MFSDFNKTRKIYIPQTNKKIFPPTSAMMDEHDMLLFCCQACLIFMNVVFFNFFSSSFVCVHLIVFSLVFNLNMVFVQYVYMCIKYICAKYNLKQIALFCITNAYSFLTIFLMKYQEKMNRNCLDIDNVLFMVLKIWFLSKLYLKKIVFILSTIDLNENHCEEINI